MPSRDSRTVLIVEPNHRGHRFMYVRLLAEAAADLGARVVVIVAESALGSPEIEAHLSCLPPTAALRAERELAVRDVERISREEAADRVVIPDGDRFALRVGLAGSWRGSGGLAVLVMRARRQPARLSALTWEVKRRLLERAEQVPRVEVIALVSALETGPHSAPSAPDPVALCAGVADVEALRAEWSMSEDRYWFGVLGVVSGRKNLDVVLAALAKSALDCVGVVVAGRLDSAVVEGTRDVVHELRSRGVDVRVQNRHLSNIEFDAAIAAVDCVIVAHDNEGPSGVLAKAVRAGTRVLAAGADSLRADADLRPDVVSWSESTLVALVEHLRRVRSMPRPAPALELGSSAFCRALLR